MAGPHRQRRRCQNDSAARHGYRMTKVRYRRWPIAPRDQRSESPGRTMRGNDPRSGATSNPTMRQEQEDIMDVRKFAITDAAFERSPGQDGEVYAGNVIDQHEGGPITIALWTLRP